MVRTLDPVILEQENQRMGHVLVLLHAFVRRRVGISPRIVQVDPIGLFEIDLEKISVAEFRRRCAWE